MRAGLLPFAVLLTALGCGSLSSGDALPPSIERVVREAYPDHRVVFCESRRSADGEPVHGVTLDRDGLRTWVLLDDRGRVLRERAELRASEVPLEILGTVRKQFPDRDIPLAIRRREGESTHYEVHVLDPSGLTSTFAITPAGMIVEDIDGEGVPAEGGVR